MNNEEELLSQKAYIIRAKEAFCKICNNKECCDGYGRQDITYRNKCGKLLEFSMTYKYLVHKDKGNLTDKKECSKCGKTYSIKYFYKSLTTADEYTTICKYCQKEKRYLKAKENGIRYRYDKDYQEKLKINSKKRYPLKKK